MASFTASIDAWVAQTKERATAVFRESSKRVIADMQTPVSEGGRMRVDTGFLRASMQASINQPAPPLSRENPGLQVNYSSAAAVATIAGAGLGDYITAAYTANYAAIREYGANGQPPDAFVRTAAAKWPVIVAQVTAELKARAR